MNMLPNLESQVTTAHRAKLAYIYVRQSTAGQVRQHQESTELQYRLVDRAAAFGLTPCTGHRGAKRRGAAQCSELHFAGEKAGGVDAAADHVRQPTAVARRLGG